MPSSLALSTAVVSSFCAAATSVAPFTFVSASACFSVLSAVSCARARAGAQRKTANLTDVWSEWAQVVRTLWDRTVSERTLAAGRCAGGAVREARVLAP